MTPRYRAVLFDLFDTLVLFERERLPEVRVNGRVIHSSAGRLHEIFLAGGGEVGLPAFVDAVLWSWQEAERLRALDHREVPAPERFRMLLSRVTVDPERVPASLLAALLAAHRHELSKATEFPDHHRRVLSALAPRYRLAVVSNFDYGPTVRGILDASGVADLFETIVVSDEVGWRKPKPVIFERALGRLGVAPEDALFVGDRPDIDVVGAHAVGMAAVWINRAGASLPGGLRPPEFEIRDLAELPAIVGA